MAAVGRAIKSTMDSRRYELATLAAAAAPLDEAERAVMAFAKKAAISADRISQADVDELAKHGLTDEEILDVALESV